MTLHREGHSQREIARHLHMSRNTVQSYISSPGFSERADLFGRTTSRKNKLDAYLPFLREQWDTGNHHGVQLFHLIKARG